MEIKGRTKLATYHLEGIHIAGSGFGWTAVLPEADARYRVKYGELID
jgi:hypothetical protein